MSKHTSDMETLAANCQPCTMARAKQWLSAVTAALPLIAALIALSPSSVTATVATSSEMQSVCQNWLTQIVHTRGSWAGDTNPQITRSNQIYSGDTLLARWYDISPRGYVLVPVLKEMQPVKAYSDEYNLDGNQESGFLSLIREMLSQRASLYASRMGSLDAPQSVTAEPLFGEGQRREWNRLCLDPKSFKNSLPIGQSAMSSAGPLLTSSWHQGPPYNNLCPVGYEDQRTVVGCVATAMAQILNYWKWPETGYGSHSYVWAGDNSCGGTTPFERLSADFSDSYDWTNVVDSCDEGCTPAQEDALAELSYETGVAIETNYGACGSGGFLAPVLPAFYTYFKFNPELGLNYRSWFDLPGWFALVQNEIDNGRVCQYFITRHSIVVDGWRNDDGVYQYHMNYGWGGPFTAWFVLDSLYCYWEPDSLCPADQEVIVTNIQPQTDPVLSCSRTFVSDPGGNNNGIAAPGETVILTLMIQNDGNTAENVTATLSTADPYVTITSPTVSVPTSVPWGGKVMTASSFVFSVKPECPDPHVTLFEITMTADGGYSTIDTTLIFIGTRGGFRDDVESGPELWTHYRTAHGFVDQWHTDDYRKQSGSFSWKAGGGGPENYANYNDSWLVSPPFLLPDDAMLTFRHWIDVSQPEGYVWAYDGGNVFITPGDGTRTLITPVDGYPYYLFDNVVLANPPSRGFSGTADWSLAQFDLSAYTGVVQLVFHFGSDEANVAEGWYIDDIRVAAAGCCGAYTGGYTGNTDCDPEGRMALSDITKLIDRVYLSKQPLCCEENGNVDGDVENKLALSDITKLIDHVYLSKQPTATCP